MFLFPSNLFFALRHRLQTQLPLVRTPKFLTGGMKLSPGVLQTSHHAAHWVLPGSCKGAGSNGASAEELFWLVISHAWMEIRSVHVCSGVCPVKTLDNLVGRAEK